MIYYSINGLDMLCVCERGNTFQGVHTSYLHFVTVYVALILIFLIIPRFPQKAEVEYVWAYILKTQLLN